MAFVVFVHGVGYGERFNESRYLQYASSALREVYRAPTKAGEAPKAGEGEGEPVTKE